MSTHSFPDLRVEDDASNAPMCGCQDREYRQHALANVRVLFRITRAV